MRAHRDVSLSVHVPGGDVAFPPFDVRPDGFFAAYRLTRPEKQVPLRAEPGEEPYTWHIHLPRDVLSGVNDVFLRFALACDRARLYLGGELVADTFYNGEMWEVGLKRFAGPLAQTPALTLTLEPLAEDAELYLDRKPRSVDGVVGHLHSVQAVPEYRVFCQ